MSHLNEMADNINELLAKIRFAIVSETLDFCDTVNAEIPRKERSVFCNNSCPYSLLCKTIDEQLETIGTVEFLINKGD